MGKEIFAMTLDRVLLVLLWLTLETIQHTDLDLDSSVYRDQGPCLLR